jgi:hypothetical protein
MGVFFFIFQYTELNEQLFQNKLKLKILNKELTSLE